MPLLLDESGLLVSVPLRKSDPMTSPVEAVERGSSRGPDSGGIADLDFELDFAVDG